MVSALTPDDARLPRRGLVEPGVVRVDGSMRIAASGVVLRGSGAGDGGTTLVATGISRRALIVVSRDAATGRGSAGQQQPIADAYVPVGARTIPLTMRSASRAGDRVSCHASVDQRSGSPTSG